MDLDEVFIRLWDAGFDDVFDPTDLVSRDALPRARTALGIDSSTEARSVAAWATKLGMSQDELRKRLAEHGIAVSPAMRNLPKGSVAKVRKILTSLAEPSPSQPSQPAVVAPLSPVGQPPLGWKQIGRRRTLVHLSEGDVTLIHWHLAAQFQASGDPIEPPGVRDESLLASAVSRPQTSLGDALKYPTAELAAAALLHSLTLNHPFYNGNKRTALVSSLVFLDGNDVALTATEPEVLKLVLRLARRVLVPAGFSQRDDREVQLVAEWIHANQRGFTHGDRPLQFRVLRRILSGFGCSLYFPGAGSRINISRTVEEKTFLGRPRPRTFETQVYYHSEGADVSRTTINKIRRDLRLDEENGCDSSAFYNSDVDTIDRVIAQYQTTLRRLARL